MKEATLVIYNDFKSGAGAWRGNVIENRNGRSIYRTERMQSRQAAILSGAMAALDKGIKSGWRESITDVVCYETYFALKK